MRTCGHRENLQAAEANSWSSQIATMGHWAYTARAQVENLGIRSTGPLSKRDAPLSKGGASVSLRAAKTHANSWTSHLAIPGHGIHCLCTVGSLLDKIGRPPLQGWRRHGGAQYRPAMTARAIVAMVMVTLPFPSDPMREPPTLLVHPPPVAGHTNSEPPQATLMQRSCDPSQISVACHVVISASRLP